MKVKSNTVVTAVWNDARTELTFKVLGVEEPIVLHREKLSAAFKDYAQCHGLKQRGGDRAAMLRDEKTGLPATPAQKHASVKAWVDYAETGTDSWNLKGVGRQPVDEDALLAALLAKKGLKAVAIEPSAPVDVTEKLNAGATE